VVRAVMQHRPAMLVIQSESHSRLARTLLTNTDWALIRHCPCPVWVSKRPKLSLNKVLAAVDPFHAHAKPGALDDIVLKEALALTGGEPKRVLAAHAFLIPAELGRAGAEDAFWVPLSPKDADRFASTGRARLAKLVAKYGIPAANQLVALGDPVQQLPQLASEYKAGVVVMGAVSRSGLKRIFIGNTAERIIDALNTDLLVVKPRDFKTPVTSKPAKVRALAWPPI
jgi:universal stress protein E